MKKRRSKFLHAEAILSRTLILVAFCLLTGAGWCEESNSVFTPPVAYPQDRYAAGWNKNPFTLKTAPVPVQQVSFAVDLAICSYYGRADDPTVVVVNTKTGTRTPIRKAHAASNGMQLKSVNLGAGRKDVIAEVMLGSETSEIKFNDSYTKQIAAGESAKTGAAQAPHLPQPNAAAHGKPQTPPNQNFNGPKPAVSTNTPQVRTQPSPQSTLKGKVAASARPVIPSPANTVTATNTAASSATVPSPNPTQSTIPSVLPIGGAGTSPIATRRRLNGLPVPEPAFGQGSQPPTAP